MMGIFDQRVHQAGREVSCREGKHLMYTTCSGMNNNRMMDILFVNGACNTWDTSLVTSDTLHEHTEMKTGPS